MQIMPVKKSRPRQHHTQLAAVVGIVQPAILRVYIPGVVPPGEAHDSVSVLAPDAEAEEDFIVAQMRVVVNG